MASEIKLPETHAAGHYAPDLTQSQKAAVIVRLLMAEEILPDLSELSEVHQTTLARNIATMRRIDQTTLSSIVTEFSEELTAIALTFPDSMDGTLSALEGHLSSTATSALRREAGFGVGGDPWARLGTLGNDRLLNVLRTETPEIAGITLSKIPVPRAAELLGLLPGPDARRITYAISRTSNIAPETVLAIGRALVDALDAEPLSAFNDGPVARVGAILNNSTSATRDDVLEGLDEQDRGFADEVRKAIFTFANIPKRISPRDVPRILRGIDEAQLVTALAGARKTMPDIVSYILDNLSRRLSDQLKEAINDRGTVSNRDTEAAMAEVVNVIRRMETDGELILLAEDEDEEEDAGEDENAA